MLDQSIRQQLISIFSGLQSEYIFQIDVRPDHPKRDELTGLLEEVAASSGKLRCEVNDGNDFSFTIIQDGLPSSIIFRAVPTGHEFTTLLLSILNMDGKGKNLPDEAITRQIRSLKGPVHIQSFISLTCTNCPDVVQSLNVMAILNPEIRHEIIDGALYQQEAASRNIQAVPSVFVNSELLHVGRAELGELLSKIVEKTGANITQATGEKIKYDVIVAGGGPAGATAAIYSARKGLKVAVVADHVGGQLTETLAIDNMISVPHTTGNQLAARLKEHMKEYTLDLLENRKIVSATLNGGMKQVTTSLGEILEAPALIIATGASWRRLNVPGESRYIGAGVAFCAHCDGPFYKGKRVAVIGGGNSGLEAAIDLSGIATEVTVLEFLDELKGDQVLQDKIAGITNIRIIKSAETISVDGDDTKVTALQYRDRKTERVEKIDLDGVFVQIGLKANSQIFCEMVEVNRFGEIVVDAHCRTSIPGIYAAGDVTTVPFKQIVIAMGEGSKAALSAFDDRMKDRLLS